MTRGARDLPSLVELLPNGENLLTFTDGAYGTLAGGWSKGGRPENMIYPPKVFECGPRAAEVSTMSHAVHEKQKLLNRIRRIRGQVEATEQAIDSDQGCAAVMHQLVACRGAINSLLAEVLEDHVREHLIGNTRSKAQVQAADELIDIAHAYFRS